VADLGNFINGKLDFTTEETNNTVQVNIICYKIDRFFASCLCFSASAPVSKNYIASPAPAHLHCCQVQEGLFCNLRKKFGQIWKNSTFLSFFFSTCLENKLNDDSENIFKNLLRKTHTWKQKHPSKTSFSHQNFFGRFSAAFPQKWQLVSAFYIVSEENVLKKYIRRIRPNPDVVNGYGDGSSMMALPKTVMWKYVSVSKIVKLHAYSIYKINIFHAKMTFNQF
jgi:hypothetical protein